jgi:transcriptional regulator with XRE-family HTH domain
MELQEIDSAVSEHQAVRNARGKRLKLARKMAGLTREEVEEKYGISASTVQSWEAAKAGGLTEKGAQRAIAVLRQEGIWCTIDWLMYGLGEGPQPTGSQFHHVQESFTTYTDLPEEKAILQELEKFKSLNNDSIHFIVNDDAMLPYYQQGDYIAGKRKVGEAIKQLIGMDCIIETTEGTVLLRRLKLGAHDDTYTLLRINPDTQLAIPTLYEQKLKNAAAVIWLRRPDSK